MKDPSRHRYAAIYVRVSTEDQGKGFSIPTQIEACQKLADREGYIVPDTHILVDEGISGTTMERPGLQRMRELVTDKAIAAAIIYDPDRLSRKLGHQLLLTEQMNQAGVKLLIVSHPMEHGPEGMVLFQVRGVFAEYEHAKLMERTHRGRVKRAQRGSPWGGEVKLGYRAIREPHQASWVIEEEEAVLVRRIFQMALAGMSEWSIAVQLTGARVPTCRDRRGNGPKQRGSGVWTPSTIHRILTYEGYTGRASWGKYQRTSKTTRRLRHCEEWVTIPIPMIIDEATFQAVQGQLFTNKATSRRNRKYDYLLTGGVLRCGRCGRAMSGRTVRGKFRYYRCASWANVTDPSARCYGEPRVDEVEPKVWEAVVQVLEQPELISAEVTRQQETADDQRAELQQEFALIETALAKCDREAQRWAGAYAAEVINVAELKGYRAEIAARRQALHDQVQACQTKMEAIGQAAGQVEMLIDYCARVRQNLTTFDAADKRRALEALGVQVTWTPGQPLIIKGRIPLGDIALLPS